MRILFLLLLLPFTLLAQESDKYLAGAVPVVDGKVIFTREINTGALTQMETFAKIARVVSDRFKSENDENGSVLYTDVDEGVIVCRGDEYLVFTKKALVLDRARISYHAIFTCSAGKCIMEVSRIRYLYENNPTPILAEDWITDEKAYDKKRNRLFRNSDKFRIKTIDLVDSLEELCQEQFKVVPGSISVVNSAKESASERREQVEREIIPEVMVKRVVKEEEFNEDGYSEISLATLEKSLFQILNNEEFKIIADNDKTLSFIAGWGGVGRVFDKQVLYTFIIPSKELYDVMDNSSTYSVLLPVKASDTPYKEVVLRCKRIISQSIVSEAISSDELRMEWSGRVMPKMYIGEIIKVLVK